MKDIGKGIAIAGIWVAAAYASTHGDKDALTLAAAATFTVAFFM